MPLKSCKKTSSNQKQAVAIALSHSKKGKKKDDSQSIAKMALKKYKDNS